MTLFDVSDEKIELLEQLIDRTGLNMLSKILRPDVAAV